MRKIIRAIIPFEIHLIYWGPLRLNCNHLKSKRMSMLQFEVKNLKLKFVVLVRLMYRFSKKHILFVFLQPFLFLEILFRLKKPVYVLVIFKAGYKKS